MDSDQFSTSSNLAFGQTNPITGEYPAYTTRLGGNIAERGRRILAARSLSEVNTFLDLVNFYLDALNPNGLLSFDALCREANALESHAPPNLTDLPPDGNCEVAQLFWGMSQFELFSPDDNPAPTWPELFATLALALLNESAEVETQYGTWTDNDELIGEYRLLDNISFWTHSAERAVAIAETLSWAEILTQRQRSSLEAARTKQHQAAAYKRHERTQQAAQKLAKFYELGNFPSMNAAVNAFIERHPDLVAHLAPNNRSRTLNERLSKLLK